MQIKTLGAHLLTYVLDLSIVTEAENIAKKTINRQYIDAEQKQQYHFVQYWMDEALL